MKPYPLSALLNLRIFRQDKAMLALQRSEKKLANARIAVKQAIEKHKEFMVWLEKEEESRYQSIMEKEMTLDEIDDFKLGLLAVRGREALYLENILKAKNRVQVCRENVDAAKRHLLDAQKGTLKIEVHRERWLELAKFEAQRAEELELEDFRPARLDLFGERLSA